MLRGRLTSNLSRVELREWRFADLVAVVPIARYLHLVFIEETRVVAKAAVDGSAERTRALVA